MTGTAPVAIVGFAACTSLGYSLESSLAAIGAGSMCVWIPKTVLISSNSIHCRVYFLGRKAIPVSRKLPGRQDCRSTSLSIRFWIWLAGVTE